MAKCDACGNDYDKAFHVVARGKTHYVRQLRVRDPRARAGLRALRRAHHRPRPGEERPDVLLRSLRQAGGREVTVPERRFNRGGLNQGDLTCKSLDTSCAGT